MAKVSKKICIMGDCDAVKSQLTRCLSAYSLREPYCSRMGVGIYYKALELKDKNLTLQLAIWDLASNSKYKRLSQLYLKGASGAVVVADINRQESIEQLSEYVQLFFSINPQSIILVALNDDKKYDDKNSLQLFQLYPSEIQDNLRVNYPVYSPRISSGDEIFKTLACQII
ncbi:MAG TPA: GTP-binding protein [Cyanobacteria bacterium UBA8803]|nr:GTP-binding protein [Cyanobacteria bacterium UBA9273]HBL61545.1 GTP-binding protein [Cyanobacteria bacterium UBA8803]